MSTLRLVCSDPKIKAVVLPAQGPFGIGRHPENDLPIVDDKVASRFHCVIEIGERDRYMLKDLGARNGTHLNGEPISTAPLSPGDVVTVGKHTFTVEEIKQKAPNGQADLLRATAKGGQEREGWAKQLRTIIDAIPPHNAAVPPVKMLTSSGEESEALESSSDGSTAIRLLVQLASKARSTDIHFEPKGHGMSVRMRVDGQMVTILELPNAVGELALGLVRIACEMKQASRETVLEGHLGVKFPDRSVDYRASITPTMRGQKLVLRVLDERIAPQSLREMNLPLYMLERLEAVCLEDSGMILTAGPTGCGKTTTLYNAMRGIDRARRNVVTIEDPVEYSIDNVTQIPISENATFSSLLRAILRQDPDVILVGEIRDEDTARTTMQAATSGHLVFSTIHAKDTIGSVFRLLDLGVEPYLVANSMDVVLAQRLVRVLCEYCKRPVRVTPGQATRMGRFLGGKDELHAATGCARCLRTGFYGRRAIFEMLEFNDDLRDCVLHEPTIAHMRKIIGHGIFTSLEQSGWLLAAAGLTSLDEVERVAGS